jgi:SAM-dependent methyltransferase
VKIFNDPSADWQRFGESQPYWAVLTDDKYRPPNIGPETLREFFESGELHLRSVWDVIKKSLDPAFAPRRALDFGCGVGRVLIPLARRCPVPLGVDVAKSMLDEARRNLAERGVAAELVLGDDVLSSVPGTFDFVHSYIVFQHIPSARGEAIASRLLERLESGGVAALHFSYRTPISSVQRLLRWARVSIPFAASTANLLRGRSASHPYMQVYEYDTARILEVCRAAGCDQIHLEFTDHGGVLGAFFYCRKRVSSTR